MTVRISEYVHICGSYINMRNEHHERYQDI